MSRFVRRIRRINASKALKPFSPLFAVNADEIVAELTGEDL